MTGLCISAFSLSGQTKQTEQGSGGNRQPVPLAPVSSATVTSVEMTNTVTGNAQVNSIGVQGTPLPAAQSSNPARNNTIQMPVSGKDAPKRIRAVKQDGVK